MPTDADHKWIFLKMHYDWQQYACHRCGCMKIVKPNGEVLYKARGKLRWNPFAALKATPPACVLHPKSTYPE